MVNLEHKKVQDGQRRPVEKHSLNFSIGLRQPNKKDVVLNSEV